MTSITSAISAISRRILALYLAVSLSLLLAFTLFVARQANDQNQVALAGSQRLADSAIRSKLDQLGFMAHDYAVWDDAYQNLVLHFSASWADKAFGVSVWNDLPDKMEGAFYVDGFGRTRYGVWNCMATTRPVDNFITHGATALIKQAQGSAEPVTRLVAVDGATKMVSAQAIRPTTIALDDPSTPRGVLVWIKPIDRDFTTTVGRTCSLENLRWVANPHPTAAHLSLTGFDGKPAGALVWDQEQPGQILIHRALLPGIVLILFCSLAGLWQSRLTMLAARMLSTEQELRRAAAARAELLSEEANTDTLTGLLNRRGLAKAGSALTAAARIDGSTVAALVVDLDRFKPVNDSHGHHVGDEVLSEVARRLAQAVRAGDVVARLGGDEFVILIAPASAALVEGFATRLIEALSFPCRCSVGSVTIGASVGIALSEDESEDVDALMRRADQALYTAKQVGRAQWRVAA